MLKQQGLSGVRPLRAEDLEARTQVADYTATVLSGRVAGHCTLAGQSIKGIF